MITAMSASPIYLSRYDNHRLREVVAAAEDQAVLRGLRAELDRAIVLPSHARVPTGLVAMDTHVTFEDQGSGAIGEVLLTLPERSDPERAALSVFDPLGTALLGCTVGDLITFECESGAKTLKILRVIQSSVAKAAGTLTTV